MVNKSEKREENGYKVGKGRPPKHTQFSSTNQPKNKNGRKRKIPELEILLADVLGEDEEGGDSEMKSILKNLVKIAKGSTSQAVRAGEVLLNRPYGLAPLKVDPSDKWDNISAAIRGELELIRGKELESSKPKKKVAAKNKVGKK